MLLPLYPGSQASLYGVCRAGVTSAQAHLAEFKGFSPAYDSPWFIDMLKQIDDAEALPDAQSRAAAAELKHLDLKKAADVFAGFWQSLKRYLSKIFKDEAVLKIKLDAAGATFYEKAANYNWESLMKLATTSKQFIDNNSSELQLGTVTPNDFPVDFKKAADDCKSLFGEFIQLEEDEKIATKNKMEANNAVYSKMIDLFKDGQDIFKDDEEVKKQFVWDEVLALVTGGGETGLKGTVIAEGTGLPLEGVELTTADGKHKKITDAEGKFDFAQIAGGPQLITANKPGFAIQQISLTLETGVTKTIEIVMSVAVQETV